MTFPCEVRWATETGAHSMISVEEAEYFGYRKWREDPRYPGTWLMVRDVLR